MIRPKGMASNIAKNVLGNVVTIRNGCDKAAYKRNNRKR